MAINQTLLGDGPNSPLPPYPTSKVSGIFYVGSPYVVIYLIGFEMTSLIFIIEHYFLLWFNDLYNIIFFTSSAWPKSSTKASDYKHVVFMKIIAKGVNGRTCEQIKKKKGHLIFFNF